MIYYLLSEEMWKHFRLEITEIRLEIMEIRLEIKSQADGPRWFLGSLFQRRWNSLVQERTSSPRMLISKHLKRKISGGTDKLGLPVCITWILNITVFVRFMCYQFGVAVKGGGL